MLAGVISVAYIVVVTHSMMGFFGSERSHGR